MQNWYSSIRERTEDIFQAIVKHDFIRGLIHGDLPNEVFQFYVNQDSLYLAEYKKVLSIISIKCGNTNDTQFFLESATGIINVEEVLHQTFLDKSYQNSEPSPTCLLYTSYLTQVAYNHSIEIGLAAILPCFTIYKEVGDYILAHKKLAENNPYQSWIETYGGEEFGQSVQKAIEITNKYAATASSDSLAKMNDVFIKASKLEWMFWDSAFEQESWKI